MSGDLVLVAAAVVQEKEILEPRQTQLRGPREGFAKQAGGSLRVGEGPMRMLVSDTEVLGEPDQTPAA